MKTPIDLGKKSESLCCPCPATESKPDEPKVYYPELYLSDLVPDGLPDEGTITFKYRISRETEDHKNPENSSCAIEVISIESVTAKEGAKKAKYDEGGDALDKLRNKPGGEDDDE